MCRLTPLRLIAVLCLSFFLTAAPAIPAVQDASGPELLQFTSAGHVLGFAPGAMVVATGSRALRVEFVDARAVTPQSAAASKEGAVALTSNGKLYQGRLNGTSGADIMMGTNGPDQIEGKGGNDRICGGEGNDIVKGNDGNDTLFGGTGNDILQGGNGTLTGGLGADQFRGDAGTDTATDFNPGQGDTKSGVEKF